MTKTDKFMEVLQTFEKSVTIAEWAKRIVELYPAVLIQTNSKTDRRMTVVELGAAISLKVSKGEFSQIEVENCTPYRKVRYVSNETKKELSNDYASRDMEIITIEERINADILKLNESDQYRVEEFKSIVEQLNRYFNMNFELHHARSLSNKQQSGKHHPDNLQLLTTEHTFKKEDNVAKFTIEEQKAYIKRVLVVDSMVSKALDITLTDEVLDMLLDRLAKVY